MDERCQCCMFDTDDTEEGSDFLCVECGEELDDDDTCQNGECPDFCEVTAELRLEGEQGWHSPDVVTL